MKKQMRKDTPHPAMPSYCVDRHRTGIGATDAHAENAAASLGGDTGDFDIQVASQPPICDER